MFLFGLGEQQHLAVIHIHAADKTAVSSVPFMRGEILCQLFRPVEPVVICLPVPVSGAQLHIVNQNNISGCGSLSH